MKFSLKFKKNSSQVSDSALSKRRMIRASSLKPVESEKIDSSEVLFATSASESSSASSDSVKHRNRYVSDHISQRNTVRVGVKTVDFTQRRKEQRKALWAYWAIRISITFTTLVLIGFTVWVLIFSPWLKVQSSQIRITGTQMWVNADTIRQITNESVGKSLILVSDDTIKKRVDDIPDIASVTVEKNYPHGLNIGVVEEKPTALLHIKDSDNYIAVDAHARTIKMLTEKPDGIPIIDVSSSNEGLTNRAVIQAITLLAKLHADLRAQVTHIEAQTQDSVTTQLSNGYTIMWGNSSVLDVKQTIVNKIIEKLQQEGTHKATIDVSAPSRPIIK